MVEEIPIEVVNYLEQIIDGIKDNDQVVKNLVHLQLDYTYDSIDNAKELAYVDDENHAVNIIN